MKKLSYVMMLSVAAVTGLQAQETPRVVSPRISVSAGLSVTYVRAKDLTDMANTTLNAAETLPTFKTAVEFFGTVSVPLSGPWSVKFDYAYFLASYGVATSGGTGQADYSVTGHFPSLLAQYTLLDAGVYDVKIGAGGGYHFGAVAKKFFTENDSYSGSGPGFIGDIEAHTAFGEHIYVYLGGNIRWEGIGVLKDGQGRNAGVAADGGGTTMHLFGAGARLGFSYFF